MVEPKNGSYTYVYVYGGDIFTTWVMNGLTRGNKFPTYTVPDKYQTKCKKVHLLFAAACCFGNKCIT